MAVAVIAAMTLAAGAAFADGPASTAPIFPTPAPAAPAAPPPATPSLQPAAAPSGQSGAVSLRNGDLRMQIPANWTLYSREEALAFLARANAPAPSGDIFGLLAPIGKPPTDPSFWGAVVSFDPVGPVAETGTDALAAPGLIDQLKPLRQTLSRSLEAFAAQPAYAPSADALTWAERYAGTAADRTHRHEQRLLGRDGVAGLTVLSPAGAFADVQAASGQMLGMLSFAPGKTLADAEKDKPSAFDLAGLITGLKKPISDALATPAGSGGPGVGAGLAGAAAGALAWASGWFHWLAMAMVALAALPWLLYSNPGVRRREDDPNLQPR
jgi:hypothetical protein